MGRVIIGMDPHKRSATIEIIDDLEQVLARGRFNTDTAGYQAMLKLGRGYKDRIWAVEGCNGIGRHIAQRLVADGEPVVDVPSKLSARARVFATGQGRKTIRSTLTRWPWWPCALRVYGALWLTTPRWRCGCWSTVATPWAGPVPSCCRGCTTCCWNWSPVEPRSTCPPRKPVPCSTP